MATKVGLLTEADLIVFRDKKYQEKLIAQQNKLNEAITQYNAAVDAGENAEQVLSTIAEEYTAHINAINGLIGSAQAIKDGTQAISESGLPAQAGNENKSLVTDGTQTSWVQMATPEQVQTALEAAALAVTKAEEAQITARVGLVL